MTGKLNINVVLVGQRAAARKALAFAEDDDWAAARAKVADSRPLERRVVRHGASRCYAISF